MNIQKNISRILPFLTVLGAAIFFYKLWYFANSLLSIGDEGAYLFKGYMFVRGDYYPFQEYAFWTNKAPLAFVIPGYIQYWFGPGLREARYFAILLSMFMLVGVWLVTNRLGGKYWAALAVWVFALSDWQTSVLSQALSQGLIACMLTWMFVLVLGKNRSTWHFVTGSALAILIIMTRQNMITVPILLVGYIFWQYGGKAGWISLATCVLVFAGFYIYYGPRLLDLWLEWLPKLQAPLDIVIPNSPNPGDKFKVVEMASRIQSFVTSVHDHIFIFIGSVSALILWRSKNSWDELSKYKMSVFLATTYFSLFVMHIWASLFNNYCIWCASSYQVFYNVAGIFFIVLFFSNYVGSSKLQRGLLFLFLLLVSGGIGLYYYLRWGVWLLKKINVPLLGRLFSGKGFSTVPLTDVFTYKFFIPPDFQDRIASTLGGVLIGLLIIAIAWALYYFLGARTQQAGYSLTWVMLACFFLITNVLAIWQDKPIGRTPCGTNFLNNYEETGHQLADIIPPNKLLYWMGSGRHLALMLYMTDVNIFPPQIHAGGGYISPESFNNKSEDDLLRKGVFNQAIDEKWREQADYHVLWSENFTKDAQEFFAQPSYEEIPFDMGSLKQCEDPLFVFRKR